MTFMSYGNESKQCHFDLKVSWKMTASVLDDEAVFSGI